MQATSMVQELLKAEEKDNENLGLSYNISSDEYIPVYDYEDSLFQFNWSELIPTLAVYGLTMVLGIVGNTLIIFTICRYRRMKSTTNVFLSNLASADLLLITICIPVKVAKLFSYSWTMGEFLCKGVHYMQSVSAICSVLTLTTMSIERYYAIVHPMRAKYKCTISQARRIVIVIWAASFTLAVSMLFVQVHMEVGVCIKAYWCVADWENQSLWRTHELYMLFLILVIPTSIMVLAYSSICWEVWHVMKRRYDMTSGQARNSIVSRGTDGYSVRISKRSTRQPSYLGRDKADDDTSTVVQVIKMLVTVVVLFVICWAPLLVYNVLKAYDVIPSQAPGPVKHMGAAFHLMAYFNSCINPIVYGFMSKNFRKSFYKALCQCCPRPNFKNRCPSISQTRTTSLRLEKSTSLSASSS
ncbi:QRFP-like peptide receptor [Anabrus simplex]|uniref:QRFP-like peptide receptor n=1 Tax=Anabrus simplex TaxID=316456 RepID=UPI0035A34C97